MNRLHVYTGDGKGKTTAAMGLALRAAGHGWPVLVGQFMKDGQSGELAALSRLPGVTVLRGERVTGFPALGDAEAQSALRRQEQHQVVLLREAIDTLHPRLIVLDELAVACGLGFVQEADARALIALALSSGEAVVTGRDAPAWLLDAADYLTECACRKHPFMKGEAAREGIEW